MKTITIATIAVLSLLCSCSPQQRFQRFIKLHPEFVQSDTLRDTVTVTVPGEHIEQAIVMYMHDTVRIDTGRTHVRIVRILTGSPCDTAEIRADISLWSDTVVVREPYEVVVEKVVPCPEGYGDRVASWWRVLAIAFLGFFTGAAIVVARHHA